MPCNPSAGILLIAHSMLRTEPHRELVLPKSMSGLTGSSGLCVTAAHTLDGRTTLAAVVKPPNASAYDMKSRLLKPRPVTLGDMDASLPDVVCRFPRRLLYTP